MKRKIFYYICILSTLVVLFSCDNEFEGMQYDQEDALNFIRASNSTESSVFHNLFFNTTKEKEILIHVRVMGNVVDYDRSISLVQVEKDQENAAISGVDFKPLDDPEMLKKMTIPAGTVSVNLPIILYKTEALYEVEKTLKLQLVENSDFKVGIEELSSFTINFSAQIEKPTYWSRFYAPFFGESWGVRKMEFLINTSGITEEWWDVAGIEDGMLLGYLSLKVKDALKERNENNPNEPLKEADGTLVTFDE